MKKFEHNKLWRSKFTEMMVDKGCVVYADKLDEDQYEEALRAKIVEESIEMLEATDQEEAMEEMADILEVMDCLCKVYGIKMADILDIKARKLAKLGSYSEQKLITDVEYPAGSKYEKYCLENPDQYPEVEDND